MNIEDRRPRRMRDRRSFWQVRGVRIQRQDEAAIRALHRPEGALPEGFIARKVDRVGATG
jgi:hypothetical protein